MNTVMMKQEAADLMVDSPVCFYWTKCSFLIVHRHERDRESMQVSFWKTQRNADGVDISLLFHQFLHHAADVSHWQSVQILWNIQKVFLSWGLIMWWPLWWSPVWRSCCQTLRWSSDPRCVKRRWLPNKTCFTLSSSSSDTLREKKHDFTAQIKDNFVSSAVFWFNEVDILSYFFIWDR